MPFNRQTNKTANVTASRNLIIKTFYRKIVFSSLLAVIALFCIGHGFLLKFLSQIVWDVNIFIKSLLSLRVTCNNHFGYYCFWKNSGDVGSIIWYSLFIVILYCESACGHITLDLVSTYMSERSGIPGGVSSDVRVMEWIKTRNENSEKPTWNPICVCFIHSRVNTPGKGMTTTLLLQAVNWIVGPASENHYYL